MSTRTPPTGQGGLRIRTRLALLHATLFLACGAVLLTVQYVAVNRIIADNRSVITIVPKSLSEGVPSSATLGCGTSQQSLLPSGSSAETRPPRTCGESATDLTDMQATQATNYQKARFVDFKALVLDSLVGQSLATLGIMALVSAGLGWWTAGRSVARLRQVTAAARQISEQNLHDRFAMVGPDDEIKELGDTFDAMLVRLERSFAANRRFAANASHELRTPLALQRTSLEIPLAEGRVPDDLRPSIERALRATARSELLVDSLLLLAKGQQGPQSYQPADLADLAGEAVDTYRAQATAAGVVVACDLERAPTSGDPVLLGQVAANLVQNAVRHNTPDSDGRGRLRIATACVGGSAELRVDNSGPLLDPAEVDALFEPFHRGTAARLATGRPGSGLGLSIVRAVVESHGGTVSARARSDGGLSVTVRLPRTPATTPARPVADTAVAILHDGRTRPF
ncbi:HAMP domain-containing histidine kinase (plasmid) [Embleya sp. NBC_00888]|uniref:sensor histidine kinase n=1 Tax=Embleya sp. NBC_00888 TaxID=2975960 RepID=UPI002F907205|nr:HAMP domain-containing histidine kinase [Embleya sp. NBC_00888]